MSYGMAASLQAAVYQTLSADPAVASLVGGDIFDAMPPGDLPDTYVSLGPEDVRDLSHKTGRGALHKFTVTVVSSRFGFAEAKEAAGAISDALTGGAMTLSRGTLVGLRFEKARARRVEGGSERRIDLTFAAHIEDDQI